MSQKIVAGKAGKLAAFNMMTNQYTYWTSKTFTRSCLNIFKEKHKNSYIK